MNAAERRVMEQALEAMLNFPDDISDAMFESIRALRAALAQEKAEPVQKPADPTEYDRRNPLGGPAARFEGIAVRLRAGEPYDEVLRDFGIKHIEEEQKPVAWSFEARHIDSAWGAAVSLKHPGPEGVYMRNVKPLYTAPPQRPPLTDAEMLDIIDDAFEGSSLLDVARAIERKVRGEAE